MRRGQRPAVRFEQGALLRYLESQDLYGEGLTPHGCYFRSIGAWFLTYTHLRHMDALVSTALSQLYSGRVPLNRSTCSRTP